MVNSWCTDSSTMLPKCRAQASIGISDTRSFNLWLSRRPYNWTVSSPDNYWLELHKFMHHPLEMQPTHIVRVQAVINNLHLTDWYFTSRLSDWVQHWLYDTLGAALALRYAGCSTGSTIRWVQHWLYDTLGAALALRYAGCSIGSTIGWVQHRLYDTLGAAPALR